MKIYYYQHEGSGEVWFQTKPIQDTVIRGEIIDPISKGKYCKEKREQLEYEKGKDNNNT